MWCTNWAELLFMFCILELGMELSGKATMARLWNSVPTQLSSLTFFLPFDDIALERSFSLSSECDERELNEEVGPVSSITSAL